MDRFGDFKRLVALAVLLLVAVAGWQSALAQEPTVLTPAETQEAAGLPAGFQFIEVGSGLLYPVDMSFLPNGDLLVAEKGYFLTPTDPVADIRLIRNGVLLPNPVARVSANITRDSGIFGITIDPNFASNHYFYVWYATGPYAPNPPTVATTVNRLVRFTYNPGTLTASGYTILLDNVTWSPYHDGGGLRFMADGTLLISTGDANAGHKAQDLALLNGKLLRIRPTATGYDVPADNPFVGDSVARPEIYALGLRNPFRITSKLDGSRMVVGDVGNQTWEEINEVKSGANYGWPAREGFCANGELAPCSPNPSQYQNPIASYLHSGPDFGGAVTGLAFYEGTSYPPEYRGRLFFADYDQGFLGWLLEDTSPATVVYFADNVARFVDMEYYRDALYLLDIVTGKVQMLTYSNAANKPPTAQISVNKSFGAAPLAVTFSGEGSSDPDDPTIRYRWDFGDGTPVLETADAWATHTYAADKNYVAKLTVFDTRGAISQPASVAVNVYSGELPKIDLDITGAPSRTLFHGGDEVTFTAVRSTTSDLDATKPWTWRVALHHNEHSHPDITDLSAASGIYDIPADSHGGATTIWYRFTLTMKTNTGQTVTVQRDLMPDYTTFKVGTNPNQPGMVMIEDVAEKTPATIKAIVGTEWHLRALDELVMGASVYVFDGWKTPVAAGEADAALLVTVTKAVQTYTMNYVVDRPAERAWLSHIAR